jgi:hypothetical protein
MITLNFESWEEFELAIVSIVQLEKQLAKGAE